MSALKAGIDLTEEEISYELVEEALAHIKHPDIEEDSVHRRSGVANFICSYLYDVDSPDDDLQEVGSELFDIWALTHPDAPRMPEDQYYDLDDEASCASYDADDAAYDAFIDGLRKEFSGYLARFQKTHTRLRTDSREGARRICLMAAQNGWDGGPYEPEFTLVPASYRAKDPKRLPQLQFAYAKHYIRGVLSVTYAMGGVGKSSLGLAEAVCMATGRDLLGQPVAGGRLKTWVWNGEDDLDLMEKRVAAICLHYGIDRESLKGWLFLNSGVNRPLCLAGGSRDGNRVNHKQIDGIIEGIKEAGVSVVIFDPFISIHEIAESDNTGIGMLVRALSRIAVLTNSAVEVVHHVRKGIRGQTEVDVEDGRGAGALLDKARSARVLNLMTDSEAAKAGIEQPRSYFRVSNGKSNLSPPPAERGEWYRFTSEWLDNGPAYGGRGDSMGVVEAWEWPDPTDDVTGADLAAIKLKIAEGEHKADSQARAWAGKAVAEVLELDLDDPTDRAKVKGLMKEWLHTGDLKVVDRKDDKHRIRQFVVVGRP